MKEFQEYPKWLPIGDGVIVWSREEEDSMRHEEPPKEEKKRGRPRKVQPDAKGGE